MSIVPSNDINPSLNSQDSSIIFLKNIIDKLDNIPHPMSRNERRGSFSANNNQFSTKEGTSNKPALSKTIESQNSLTSISNPKIANKTRIKFSFDMKKSENFVYNNMLRANSIKRKISNDMRPSIENVKKKDKSNTVDNNNNTEKKNIKEKIACCFFFKK